MGDRPDILVLGLGTSGAAVARYCAARPERFASVTAVDGAQTPALAALAAELETLGVSVALGAKVVDGHFDMCVASPGIPPHTSLMRSALEVCEKTISEIEFAFTESRSPWVAVTGTNGKTTTTSLIAHVLETAGVPARAIGNIGPVAIDAVAESDPSVVLVAEVSSFQLAFTDTFHPRVAVMLNLAPDHIDWHGSYQRYAADKARIFANLGPEDTAVIDVDDSGSAVYAPVVAATGVRVVPVSAQGSSKALARVVDGRLVIDEGQVVAIACADELRVRGPHNLSNALAAIAATRALGVTHASLHDGLVTFQPIEHRLEPTGVVGGAEWFNDSKATNPDAVSKAIGSFPDRPLVLLLGGRNKGNDFGPLAVQAAENAKAVVVFGEARDEIAAAFAGTRIEPVVSRNLRGAVAAAAQVAEAGDAVVLSPACASFDEFSDYAERGRTFKRMVAELAESAVKR